MSSDLATYDPRGTYNAAAADYDATSAQFWRFSARETVRRLGLRPTDRVLDVACGPGPVALEAARHVDGGGSVVGVDVAEEMLALARRHADEQGARNATFEIGTMDQLRQPYAAFDAVTCVFGLFFATDITASLQGMRDRLVPGGRLAVTTLGPRFFSPMFEAFLRAATEEEPTLDTDVPWRRTEDPDVMADHLAQAGVYQVSVSHEVSQLRLSRPEDWWSIAMGTGIRRLAMELDDDALARVREHNLAWIREHDITTVDLGVIYCQGGRP